MREPGRVSGPTPSERRRHTPRGASFVTSSKDKTTAGESGGERGRAGRRWPEEARGESGCKGGAKERVG